MDGISLYYVLDLVFIKKSGFVSQSFFLLNPMIALILVMTGIWLVARYTRHLGAREADGREEVLEAERDRLKNDLAKAGICLLGMSLIVVPLSLIYPSSFVLWLSAFAIVMVVGIISFWAIIGRD